MQINLEINKDPVREPKDLAKIFQTILNLDGPLDRKKEHFWVMGLNTRLCVEYIELVSLGTLNKAIIAPREIFRPAIFHAVNQIVLCHNHPSGTLSPSAHDIRITEKLIECGKMLEIEVLDHLIITEDGFVSMVENTTLF